eukprot:Tbor_TRINITY_DN2348_c0_g1::TRINITY_DN2348_c0_g1_i1::g.182::m.182
MLPVRKAVIPGGGQVILDPKWRTFRLLDSSRQITSVSKILGKFFPFDDKKASEYVAMKNNTTVEEVKAEWLKSAHLGTNVHEAIETHLLGKPLPVFQGKRNYHGEEHLFVPAALESIKKIQIDYEIIGVEAIVVSKQLCVAGTVDFIARHRKTKRLLIGDWKTTASALSSFRFAGFQEPADGILSHLPNAKPCRSAIQVLMLGYIMRIEGYSSIYGNAIANGEIDYGIVNIGKAGDNSEGVSVTFDKVHPLDVIPPDLRSEVSSDDLIRSILSGHS